VAKKITIHCDRCGKSLGIMDEQVDEDWYPGQDICADCSTDIEMIKGAAQSAAIQGIGLGEAFKRWLGAYQDDTE
jgi:hypothetical protein